MSHHSLAGLVVFAVAWLLSCGLSFADGPPAQDTEQRLKALEAKMDRVLQLLARRGDARPPTVPEATAAVEEARAKVREQLTARMQQLEALQKPQTNDRPINERIEKLDDFWRKTRDQRQDLADQLARIEKAYRSDGPGMSNAEAMKAIKAQKLPIIRDGQMGKYDEMLLTLRLQLREVLQVLGANNPRVKEIEERIKEVERMTGRDGDATKPSPDDARTYIKAMKQEIEVLDKKIEMLTNMIEVENKLAREIHAAEVGKQRLQTEIDRLRQMLAGLDAVLQAEPGRRPR